MTVAFDRRGHGRTGKANRGTFGDIGDDHPARLTDIAVGTLASGSFFLLIIIELFFASSRLFLWWHAFTFLTHHQWILLLLLVVSSPSPSPSPSRRLFSFFFLPLFLPPHR